MSARPVFDNLFIGAGAMKAGTTWLYSVLDMHPEVFFSLEKEIHYFYARAVDRRVLRDEVRLENVQKKYLRIDPTKSAPEAVRNRLRWAAAYLDGPLDDDWYRGLFMFRRDETYMADFSNLYALLPAEAWSHLAGRTERLRVLYTMRDPLKRLWSHVKFHLKVTGKEEELDRWSPNEFLAFMKQPFIWDNAEYGRAIRSMKTGLSPDMLKITWHEEIHANEEGFLDGLENFLGVAHHAFPADRLRERVNATAKRQMPDFFADILARDIERIMDEVRAEGLDIPASWTAPGLQPAA